MHIRPGNSIEAFDQSPAKPVYISSAVDQPTNGWEELTAASLLRRARNVMSKLAEESHRFPR